MASVGVPESVDKTKKDIVLVVDPSATFDTDKDKKEFRDYTAKGVHFNRVRNTYHQMHTHQTYQFAKAKFDEWCKFDHGEMTMMEVLDKLNNFVDESDPDVDIPNSMHAFQTAERIREIHPDNEWFHLTGFIHDLGKIMASYGEPQWCVVGDTFPVGCAHADECVFGRESFTENPDFNDPRYNTRLGQYEENGGLDKVVMSWGHDEYLYRVLLNNESCSLPQEALYIIRFHSFYPWHTGGAYTHLCNNKDREMLPWIKEFSKFDLYSKTNTVPDVKKLAPYYQYLVDKFVPGKIKW